MNFLLFKTPYRQKDEKTVTFDLSVFYNVKYVCLEPRKPYRKSFTRQPVGPIQYIDLWSAVVTHLATVSCGQRLMATADF